MIEHLIVLLIEALAKREKAQQQAGLETAVPDLDRLRTDPARFLAEEDVVIPPARNNVASLIAGGIIAVCMFAVLLVVLAVLQRHVFQFQPVPRAVRRLALAGGVAVLCGLVGVGFLIVRRWLRGGELHLRRSGAEFRYRAYTVTCPWSMFRFDPTLIQGDSHKILLPVAANTAQRVELLWNDSPVAIGPDIRVKPFRFLSDTELELTNVYAADLRQVAHLLQRIGSRLG